MNFAKKSLIIPVLVVFSVLMVSGCTSDTTTLPDEIIIGFNADQTSDGTGRFGLAARHGMEIAVEEINADGGILGKQVRAIILDDHADIEISRENAEKLIFEDGAIAIIGPCNSANAFYWMDLAQENQVMMMVPIATATDIIQVYSQGSRNYVFRVSAPEIEQVRLYIAWMMDQENIKNLAIIHDSTEYGENCADDVSDVLSRWGRTPVSVQSFDRGVSTGELKDMLISANESDAEAISLCCLADSVVDTLFALEDIDGYDPILFGTAANYDSALWERAGPLASKVYFVPPITQPTTETGNRLQQEMIDRYGMSMSFSSAAGAYDIMYFLKAAIEGAGSLEPEKIHDSLEALEDIDGAYKLYDKPFSKGYHDAITAADMYLAQWKEGEIVSFYDDLSGLEIR